MGRLAIFNNADTPEIESTAVMLRAAGYDDIRYCGPDLRNALQAAGCDTVLAVQQMYALGYDAVENAITPATVKDMDRADLFVEIKVRNVPRIEARWPRLKGRVLYKRVNGAAPEICAKGGDEVRLPCPVLTACLWYGVPRYRNCDNPHGQQEGDHERYRPCPLEDQLADAASVRLHDTDSNAYVMWPPYPRSAEYDRIDRTHLRREDYGHPFGICHRVDAWGYKPIVSEVADMGVNLFGNGSPAGQISHRHVAALCATGLALVHLKSVDCPGWALYEAMLSGVPVVTGRLLNSRMLAYGLLEHGETCLEFGVPASQGYGRGPMEYPKCAQDIREALERLRDPDENKRIGEAGRKRLNALMWSAGDAEDVASFRKFMARHFGG